MSPPKLGRSGRNLSEGVKRPASAIERGEQRVLDRVPPAPPLTHSLKQNVACQDYYPRMQPVGILANKKKPNCAKRHDKRNPHADVRHLIGGPPIPIIFEV